MQLIEGLYQLCMYYGPELISPRLMEWAAKHQIHIQHIQPGKPQQNTYIERFNHAVSYHSIIGKALTKFRSS